MDQQRTPGQTAQGHPSAPGCLKRRSWLTNRLAAVLGVALLWAPAVALAQNVTTYHGAANRSGLYVTPAMTWSAAAGIHLDTGFHATIQGQVYAQPLYWVAPGTGIGEVIAATEANVVYALNGATGAVVWQRLLGPSVPLSSLPCGDINPIGVTGTPVIDPTTQTLYVDALVNRSGGPRHLVFALSLTDGTPIAGWPIDVASALANLGQAFNPRLQGERSALAIVNGRLYITYSGNNGDCGPYNGWVVGFNLAAKQVSRAWATRAQGGGIWGQGGVAYDGTSMFMATGNTKGAVTWSDGEGVFRLDATLAHKTGAANYYTPLNWQSLDSQDLDLGATAPVPVDVPLSTGTLARLLALGKDGNAYLLDRANLGGVGGQLAMRNVSTSKLKTAPAVYRLGQAAMVAFQGVGSNCPASQASGNLTVLKITGNATQPITTAWCGTFSGRGAPIVTTTDGTSQPIVWVVGAGGDSLLHGFRGTDGVPLFTGGGITMTGLHSFQTIVVGGRHFYVAADGTVYAFTF
jgi:hypothetical protein